ncbi:endo-beta-N-acetylglucosaminidase [Streptomyces sp. B-S-A8]|uniref:Endo-beta-N-acetylglucosaminidase n=1 Tax=Streptomyces solicavernae TaxID=3043614 RepID=A0ABT6RPQ2_9ACTN|nr:endo-beta-N-acetylglucosaminidase [Streptomyces sp. B-S-A8]MDI3386398.1 endo-beta-N-acetylglucosaminidase [Streptomyces sp. B-S-A8]
MTHHPTRRTVVLTPAAAAAALLTPATRATAAPAQDDDLQPYASYWFPDSLPSGTPGEGVVWRSLLGWTPEGDPDLAFNRSTTPLAERFTPVPVNASARADRARIASLVSFHPTAGNPSQGAATADHYALTHWAYLDELVFWGGSSGEGIVLAPNAPVVDAAHRNGVPVLGNVFLPPAAYGGQLRWTRDLVQRDARGGFPVAEKLVQVATAYGFDGWFVNAETDGGDPELGAHMLAFVEELKRLGAPHGLRVTWYDAMTANGSVDWQNELNAANQDFFLASDTMFVNFDWNTAKLAASARLAQDLDRGRYELWAGVDVESEGLHTPVDWDAVLPAGADPVVSYGFYRPEWTLGHLPEGRTPGQFHAADDRFWTGESLDPARPGGSWRAPASAVADRSTVTDLPFACAFNTGHGLKWYEDGRVRSDAAWNQLGLQDRLPGRRWVVRTEGARPQVALDFADAWRGGSSLLVDGAPDAPVTVELHAVRLPLSTATVVRLAQRVVSGGPVRVELGVALREPDQAGDPQAYAFLPVGKAGAGGWSEAEVRLASLGGSGTVHGLAVRLTASGPVRWRLGALAVRDAEEQIAAPSGLRVDKSSGDGQFRLSWRPSPTAPRHYELHRVLPDGTRRFLTGTCARAAYVKGLAAEPGEKAVTFELRAVGELFTPSEPIAVTHPW